MKGLNGLHTSYFNLLGDQCEYLHDLGDSDRGADSHASLAKAFAGLLEKMWTEESSRSTIPDDLKVCK